ncbi:MAG: NAD+ synthase [Kiritimatiellae bacterium]|jgi:NAD+ synthase (glutamine-hydrolysing)|nr:NAD+ synthase [Kiritimatiellia bacterium]NLD90935.1 NAD+ synthase [Lentisphaerota bacterium]HQN79874.1 NAD+ synthase [Kiritimatiellia bacterium]HQQ60110.1 NAD+ synthase [Kiritimatiellia bacterium]
MKFALVQMNPTVGAVAENAGKIVQAAQEAASSGAEVAVFPEQALCGYPPDDLVLRPGFMDAVETEEKKLVGALPGSLLAIVGAPLREGGKLYNAALLFHGGKRVAVARKMLLPNYGVFDERRIFTPGTAPLVFKHRGVRLAVHICEDSWWPDSESFHGLRGGCDLLVNLSASPYCRGRANDREEMARKATAALGVPLLYTNLVGGQDELVFDGGAMALAASGQAVARSALFREGQLAVDVLSKGGVWAPGRGQVAELPGPAEEVYEALKLGLKDYTEKNGFPGVIVALSGGIDSALVATIAVDALGKRRVFGVTLPSAVTSPETLADAQELARRLGIPCLKIPIAPAVGALQGMLDLAGLQTYWTPPRPGTLVEENVQARVRGVVAMALSNRYGYMVVATGNKSEMATGYATLYGDMCGGFALLKDVPKTLVFELARWRNRRGEVIPPTTISRPPSAELRPEQRDSDSLPPYDLLDPILERYVERQEGLRDIVTAGYDEVTVRRVIRMVDCSEYKRRQGAPGVKITPRAFGRDRRMPITNGFRE